ncbi:hypothetical protein RIF29_20564 [Crotalaria pallida]|uniref:Uncharacterized protein n=1 Tax=Crotalaria pallida TaxID=3830 RepID=A0AAN9F1F1_CROPI
MDPDDVVAVKSTSSAKAGVSSGANATKTDAVISGQDDNAGSEDACAKAVTTLAKTGAVTNDDGWNPLVDMRCKGIWSQVIPGRPMNQIIQKLHQLRKPFRALNKQSFADIDKKEVDLRERLDVIQSLLAQNHSDSTLQQEEKKAPL